MTAPRPGRSEGVALLLAAAELAIAAAIWRAGPARIATHYGIDGTPDRWSSSAGAAASLAALACVVLAVVGALGVSARRPWADAARRRGLGVAQALVAGVGAVVTVLLAAGALHAGGPGGRPILAPLALSLILLGVGLALGRAPPNAFVGVRTPWSFSSRLAWDKSNRLAGRLMLGAGVLGLAATAALSAAQATPLIAGMTLAAAVASVFESWRVWRADPEKRPV